MSIASSAIIPSANPWYNASSDKLLFTSYERDAESSNDYAMMRYHINRLARFSSPDVLGGSTGDPQSLNHYSYGLNDPANLIDPSGLFIANAPPDPTSPWNLDRGGGDGNFGFGCFDTGDDFQNENTYFPTFSSSGCLYLGPLLYGGHGGSGGAQKTDAQKQEAQKQLDCAKQVVAILFALSGLSTLVPDAPKVTVGNGNWINFTTNTALSLGSVFSLTNPVTGLSTFAGDPENPFHAARGNLTPSLHLQNLSPDPRSPQQGAFGHVDASNLFTDPMGHLAEAASGTTEKPCDILQGLTSP